MSYEESENDQEFKIDPIINQNNNNNSNIVSDSKSKSDDKEKLFDDDVNEDTEVTPKTTVNAKVVWEMKKLQASYNDDTNKIIEEAAEEKNVKETWIFWLTWQW